MKLTTAQHATHAQGVLADGQFGISREDEHVIVTMLRDKMYTNKPKAVLREYGTNAWDAHREAGKPDLPFRVTLPTRLDPTLSIRDYGLGLSQEDVLHMYTKYGRSLRRGSNLAAGMYGFGCKAGFAYTNSFLVISYFDGTRSTYSAYIDETNIGKMVLLHEEPTSETGIEIRLQIRLEDIFTFTREAQELYRFFSPHPHINTTLTTPDGRGYDRGYTTRNGGSWIALMGCVPYAINVRALFQGEESQSQLRRFMDANGGCLYVPIGDVDVGPAREEVEYTKKSIAGLKQVAQALYDEIEAEIVSLILGPTGWARRLKARCVIAEVGSLWAHVPLARETAPLWKPFEVEQVAPNGDKTKFDMAAPTKFTFLQVRENKRQLRFHPARAVPIRADVRVYLADERVKNLSFYDPPLRDAFFIRPTAGVLPSVALQEFEQFTLAAELDGLPVGRLSSLEYVPKTNTRSAKHKAKTFVFDPDMTGVEAASDRWSVVEEGEEIDSTDAYVLLERFQAVGLDSFVDAYKEHSRVVTALGGQMPTVYGFKRTEKAAHPELHFTAVPYTRMVESIIANLLKGREVELAAFYSAWRDDQARRASYTSHSSDVLHALRKLHTAHPLRLWAERLWGTKRLTDVELGRARAVFQPLVVSALKLDYAAPSPEDELTNLLRPYKLLRYHIGKYSVLSNFSFALRNKAEVVIQYIQLVDDNNETRTTRVTYAGEIE